MSKYIKGYPPSKYNEKLSGIWYIFGVGSNGNVDLADVEGDLLTDVPKELADQLIKMRYKHLAEIAKLIEEF